jgi:hypothetical protein
MQNFAYLIAIIVTLAPIWCFFYVLRKDQRKEMLEVSSFIGLVSIATCYLWWTQDWWSPDNITGTRVGIEDFLIGFFAGGIMTSGYEIILRLYDNIDAKLSMFGRLHALCILSFLTIICAVLYWGLGLPSALACFVALVFSGIYTLIVRFDLWKVSIGSGFVTLIAIVPFYAFLVAFSPQWVDATYPFEVLTGIRIYNVPIEEFIFWFLSGLVFGPFYEILHGFKELKVKSVGRP